MKEYEFKILEEYSNNIFSNQNFENIFDEPKLTSVFQKIEPTQNVIPKNNFAIGDALLGNTAKFNSLDKNGSVFNNFNSANEETKRQYIAANRELKPVKFDEKTINEMKKFNLLDD